MSADNAVFVQRTDTAKWAVWEDSMSSLEEGSIVAPPHAATYASREEALVAAHDLAREIGIVEYGVREVPPATAALALVGHIRAFLAALERGVTSLPCDDTTWARVVVSLAEAVRVLEQACAMTDDGKPRLVQGDARTGV